VDGIQVWNVTTGELFGASTDLLTVECILKLNNYSSSSSLSVGSSDGNGRLYRRGSSPLLVCGLKSGEIELLRVETTSPKSLLVRLARSKREHVEEVATLCELDDGTFVSGSRDKSLIRWNVSLSSSRRHPELELEVLQRYLGHCLRTIWLQFVPTAVLVLSADGCIVVCTKDRSLRVWSPDGDKQVTPAVKTSGQITAMVELSNGNIVVAHKNHIEVREVCRLVMFC